MENAQQYDRFKDAPWFSAAGEQVLIGGAGGIGSWLALFLTRAGFAATLYDPDTVEAHNTGGQMFRRSDIGRHKTDAVEDIVETFCGDQINTFRERVRNGSPAHAFAFSAFDNMKARRDMFENWKQGIANSPVVPLLVDGRLDMEQVQVFCVTPDTMREYERDHLFPDAEVPDAPCTLRQTTHTAALIAALMTGLFTNHIANVQERAANRAVPFFHEFFVPLALTKTLW